MVALELFIPNQSYRWENSRLNAWPKAALQGIRIGIHIRIDATS